MSDDFFRSRMGHRFYEATMPKMADELERLNTNIENLVDELRKLRETREADRNATKPPTIES